MQRRHFNASLCATALATGAGTLASVARAQGAPGAPVEGREYTRITPPQTPNAPAGKVEVIEFFSYACPHCHAFEPTLEGWVKALPPDVVFKRVPVTFLFNAANFQRTYYALESMGLAESMSMKVFNAYHIDKQRLDKPDDIAALVTKNGGDGAKFLTAFKSFSVATSVNKATKMTADYKVDGVPALAIHGRWMTAPSTAGSAPRALQTADFLIAQARKG